MNEAGSMTVDNNTNITADAANANAAVLERADGYDLSDRFNILEELSPGRAFRAYDSASRKQVFLKRWEPGDEAFCDEVTNLSSLDSPHAPAFICSYEDGTGRYLAEEWIDGVALDEYVRRNGPLGVAEAAELAVSVCEALSFMHWDRGGAKAFLDLKPSNILVRQSYIPAAAASGRYVPGAGTSVYLVDYEAARRIRTPAAPGPEAAESAGDRRTYRIGSRYFTAPEVLFGGICVQSDIYALGVLMGFMLTGREGYPASYAIKGLAGEFIVTCTEADPNARYKGVSAAVEALREIQRTENGYKSKAARGRKKTVPGAGSGRSRGNGPTEERSTTGAGQTPGTGQASGKIRGVNTPAAQAAPDGGGEMREASTDAGGDADPFRGMLVNFRRSCVMVEGNPCFVSELAETAADKLKLCTGVFSLTERGRRSLEYYFDAKFESRELVAETAADALYPYVFDHKSLYLHGPAKWRERGLLKLSDESVRGALCGTRGTERGGSEHCGSETEEPAGGPALYRGTFKLGLELPLRRTEDVRRFVDWCLANFDLTLINVDRGDDRTLVNTVMEACSYVVATPDSNVEDMEAFRNYYMSLAENGRIVYSKVRYVAWDFSDREATRERLRPIVGSDKYLGEVRRSELRTRRRNRIFDVSEDGTNTGPHGSVGNGAGARPGGTGFRDSSAEWDDGGQYEEILMRLIG